MGTRQQWRSSSANLCHLSIQRMIEIKSINIVWPSVKSMMGGVYDVRINRSDGSLCHYTLTHTILIDIPVIITANNFVTHVYR